MVKAISDVHTLDIIEPAKRGRGRPAAFMSDEERAARKVQQNADRQRRHREKLAEAGKVSLTANIPAALMAQLDEFLKFKDETKDHAVERALFAFLRKR